MPCSVDDRGLCACPKGLLWASSQVVELWHISYEAKPAQKYVFEPAIPLSPLSELSLALIGNASAQKSRGSQGPEAFSITRQGEAASVAADAVSYGI